MEELEMDELERMRQRIQQLYEERAQLHHNIDELAVALQDTVRSVKQLLSQVMHVAPNLSEEEINYIVIEPANDLLDRLVQISNDVFNNPYIVPNWALQGRKENIDVRRATEEILIMLTTKLRGRSLIWEHSVILDFAPEPLFAYAGPDLFGSILLAFIVSASSNSPGGGEIRVIGRTEPICTAFPEGTLLMGFQDPGRWYSAPLLEWSQRVKNNESHIQEDARPLCLARGIAEFLYKYIEWHGGHMWAETNGESQGITMWFRIPYKGLT